MATFEWPSGGGSGGGSSGSQASSIPINSNSVSVTFTTQFGSTSYVPLWSIQNTGDPSPIFLDGYISAKSTTGFTVTFNTSTDTANYVFNYAIFGYI